MVESLDPEHLEDRWQSLAEGREVDHSHWEVAGRAACLGNPGKYVIRRNFQTKLNTPPGKFGGAMPAGGGNGGAPIMPGGGPLNPPGGKGGAPVVVEKGNKQET